MPGANDSRDAVVVQTYVRRSPFGGDIEIVYLDAAKHAVNVDAIWRDGCWVLADEDRKGGKADEYARLKKYVAELRGLAG